MKADIAEKWVNALESGEYKQTRGKLQDQYGYCCLGVLCDLAIQENVIPEPILDDNYYVYGENKIIYYLPVKVLKWAGMKDTSGTYGEEYNVLSYKNDNGSSFKEIAKIIRENVDNL